MSEFSVGQLVKLKSGGPTMAVANIAESPLLGGDSVLCKWFDDTGNMHSAVLNEQILEHV